MLLLKSPYEIHEIRAQIAMINWIMTNALFTGNLPLVVTMEYVKWIRLRMSGRIPIVLRIDMNQTKEIDHEVCSSVSVSDSALVMQMRMTKCNNKVLDCEGAMICK